MFVRVKQIRQRRYAYLVEGRRKGARVSQKVVCYLGPLSKIAYGIPQDVVRSEGDWRIDWKVVNDAISRIPLRFEELTEARRYRLPAVVEGRSRGFLTSGTRERVEGEGEALSVISAAKFRQAFVEVGRRRYRMN